MKFTGVENAHTESAIPQSRRLHAFVHEPELPVTGEKVFEPNTCDLMASGASQQGKERIAHSSGQFDVNRVDLKGFASQEHVERASTPLVRLEERYVRKHVGSFVAFRQNDLSIGP